MRILVVGNGGREHALLWKLRRDAPDTEFFATRPNAGMAQLAAPVPIAPTDIEALSGWAAAERIDLAVVGPEAPLAMGLVDRFKRAGVPAFGPTASAARIESSKAFAKSLMEKAGVPTAGYRLFTELAQAKLYIEEVGAPVVVKASGLAAGKGAVVCMTTAEAIDAAHSMMGDLRFGEAGREVLVEEFMEGEELSLFALCDGEVAVPLLASQDHKRIGEGDTGPNTGGMGAYAPVALATPDTLGQIQERVLLPTLHALASVDAPFQGLLYAGIMLTQEGPRVVEFNCRFGDPETQAILPLMDAPLLPLLERVAEGGSLGNATVPFTEGAAVTTVLASGGYPGPYAQGVAITIGTEAESEDCVVFHGGTAIGESGMVTAGGRVISVTGLGETLQAASAASLAGAAAIEFEGKVLRRDIGWREFARAEAARV